MAKIKELIQQDLPQLVDERRFRRRDQEQVERDEFGRVRLSLKSICLQFILTSMGRSANGRRRRSLSI